MRKTKSYANQRVTHLHIGNGIRHWYGKHLMNNLLLDFWLVFSLTLHAFIRSRSVCFMHAINCPLDIQSVTVVEIGQHLSFVVTFVFTVLLHIVNCHFHNLNALHWQWWWWWWVRVALINKTDTIVRSPFPLFHLYLQMNTTARNHILRRKKEIKHALHIATTKMSAPKSMKKNCVHNNDTCESKLNL